MYHHSLTPSESFVFVRVAAPYSTRARAPQYHYYSAIALIIEKVCKEHGVEHIHLNTFREAMSVHIAHLRSMGRQVSILVIGGVAGHSLCGTAAPRRSEVLRRFNATLWHVFV